MKDVYYLPPSFGAAAVIVALSVWQPWQYWSNQEFTWQKAIVHDVKPLIDACKLMAREG
jgi:hypothetical protein